MAIHPTAIVDPGAQLDSSVEVGAYSLIGPHVKIAAGTKVGPHVVIEGHTETEDGLGHEEVYVVLRGRATFTLDGTAVDAPAGTFVAVLDPSVHRRAVAVERAEVDAANRRVDELRPWTLPRESDALDDALGDLNKSTNRLRRKFDATDKWIETKSQVENVVEDGRKINQVVARGNYGAEAARLWAVLRTGVNDLARAYGVQPLGV